MNEDTIEHLASAFDKIATALEGLHDEAKKAGTQYWPKPREQKEVIVSRVPTEEDKIRERQGAGDTIPIDQWLEDLGDPEGDAGIVGERSRQWIIDHPPEESTKAKVVDASPEVVSTGEQDAPSVEEVES